MLVASRKSERAKREVACINLEGTSLEHARQTHPTSPRHHHMMLEQDKTSHRFVIDILITDDVRRFV